MKTLAAVAQILDSLEEIQCLTDCGDDVTGGASAGSSTDFLQSVFTDKQLHALLNVSTCTCKSFVYVHVYTSHVQYSGVYYIQEWYDVILVQMV